MRYCKGSTIINLDSDIPLLRHVRDTRFVGQHQLFELLAWDAGSMSQHSYNWRLQRLWKTGFIERIDSVFWNGRPVYSIAKNGLAELEAHGEYSLALNSNTRQRRVRAEVLHALELTEIRLSLIKRGLLTRWSCDLAIESFNIIARQPFQKEYDAIVGLLYCGETREFALEYERTLKSSKRYDLIFQTLQSENLIDCILYLTADPKLLEALVQQLSPLSKHVGFATARAFREQGLAANLIQGWDMNRVTVGEFLLSARPCRVII